MMFKDAMAGHLTGCSGADLSNLLTSTSSAFFTYKTEKLVTSSPG